MINVRKNVFDTNSSSVHSIAISNIKDSLDNAERKMRDMMYDEDFIKVQTLLDDIRDIVDEYYNYDIY